MDRPIISYGLEERDLPEIAGGLVAAWVEDVVYATEYWALRTLQSGLAAIGWLRRRPAAILVALGLAGGSAVALNVRNQLIDAQYTTADIELSTISNSVELYEVERGAMPARLEELVPRYIKQLPRDPWGRGYALFRGPGGLAIVSAGRDGVLGTPDDVVRIVRASAAARLRQ